MNDIVHNGTAEAVGLAQPVELIHGTQPPAPAPVVEAIFKSGDIVMLKSGGISMTVARTYPDGRCECCYYDVSKITYSGAMFYQDMLEPSRKMPI